MARPSKIKGFIIQNVDEHPTGITSLAADEFGVTRQAVLRQVNQLVADGVLKASGERRFRTYHLAVAEHRVRLEIRQGMEEHVLWEQEIEPQLQHIARNVLNVCNYGFTEMCNNVLDHADAEHMVLTVRRNAKNVDLTVEDDGVGIFRKIRTALALNDERAAILELSKGKFTTDRTRHSGEGIFFTSRMFDSFSILSHHLFFTHDRATTDDWLIEHKQIPHSGTLVNMQLAVNSSQTTKDVFDMYSTGDDYSFSRTHVPVSLAQYGDSNLVSRSQARRVLARFESFKEVLVDFQGVNEIGQAFADEIFRVYKLAHPDIDIQWVRAGPAVEQMIRRAQATFGDSTQPNFFNT